MNTYFVYIMASGENGTLYVGVTNDLARRVHEHKDKVMDGFTSKYGVNKLVYYEQTESIEAAIQREKQLKYWKRYWKLELVNNTNPEWNDLMENI